MLSHHLIREARRRAGLTQSELAALAGTTQSAVARWEAGRSLPSIEKLCELVECCGLELGVSLTVHRGAEEQLLRQRRALSPAERLQRLLAAVPYLGGEAASDATGGSDAPEAFDPAAILDGLERNGVRYVLLGGLAATLHGAPSLTTDVDVAPERSAANLQRLALALSELAASAHGAGDPRGWSPALSADGLARATVHRLETRYGPLDLLFRPTGTGGYDDLRQRALRMSLGDVTATVASLGDVIRSKEAAARSDDRVTVPLLRRLQRLAMREDRAASEERSAHAVHEAHMGREARRSDDIRTLDTDA